MNKIKKTLLLLLLLLIIVGISTNVRATTFDVFLNETEEYISGERFSPTSKLGGVLFCIHPHAAFSSDHTTITREEYNYYSTHRNYPIDEYICTYCTPHLDRPWVQPKYFMRYESGAVKDWSAHQDEAYNLANWEEEGVTIVKNMDTQFATWASTVSDIMEPYTQGEEGKAYKEFYEQIQGSSFESLVKDQTGSVDVGVNQSEGSYTVGPFKMTYPKGQFNGENKFCWINNVELYTDAGTLPVQLLWPSGATISMEDLKEKGTETLNGKEFYIKFYSTSAKTITGLHVEFGYIDHCEAQMQEYIGTKWKVWWELGYKGTDTHSVVVGSHEEEDEEGNEIIVYEYEDKEFNKRRWEFQEAPTGNEMQKLMLYTGTAIKVRKTADVTIAKSGIDLTMKLAGTVFLDKDTGKVNEGNNKLDSKSEEGLPGIEVYLYEIGGSEVARTHTDDNGDYLFTGLNSQKDYYVEFVYNGMLYTNVERLKGNSDNISKATEEAYKAGNRQEFNNKFKEIGSNPNNYYSPTRKGYNQVFLQEEVADIFKEVANNYGSCGNSDKETYVKDIRIRARSTESYPLTDIFTIENFDTAIAGQNYPTIYAGAYDQLHINLGIKARPTFDLAIYKDVFNATLNINGQQEVYTYDARKDWENKGFSYGVNEDYYLNQLREKYINGTDTNIATTEIVDEGQYSHEYRTEEIVNGNNQNTAINESKLYNESKDYAWRDINHGLADSDKLQIHVTYKLAIRNQSNVIGSVTEIVDYYDSNYQFENAYVGDKDGNKINDVTTSNTSMYTDATRIGKAEGSWKVGGEDKTTNYKTIYLRPVEQKLYKDHEEQYIYVTFGLIDPEDTLIKAGLPNGNTFYTYNMAEINGYKTYGTFEDGLKVTDSLGLVDRDSNPGNFNPETYVMGKTEVEDDTSRAPAYAYSIRNSRTLEGTVFEDALTSQNSSQINTNKTRFGNGTIDEKDKKIQDVKVELVEIKNGSLIVRQTTYTDENGWYGFGAFLPGDYTIRFTYGAEDKTALTTTSQYIQGLNDTSYNGQDYQSTTFTTNTNETLTTHNYVVDATLQGIYNKNNAAKNSEEAEVTVAAQAIKKYESDTYYWFDDPYMANKSDAEDDAARRLQVVAYSKTEYGKEITNHKAEVFNSYINQKTLREAESNDKNFDETTQAQPMEAVVDTADKNRELVNELERRTYMYAYTPEIKVEVEYTTKQIAGNLESDKYTYKIVGVDFGVVERARSQLTIDQDIEYVKVTASDGTTLLELQHEETGNNLKVIVNNGDNYMYKPESDFNKYDKEEQLNIILDDELLSGSKLEIRYRITLTNNSEANTGTTRAKTIINYVANNLNFDLADNNGLWEAVKKENIQTTISRSTYINNETGKNNVKLVDLTTQTTVLKATENNPLTKALNPGESVASTLTLKKTLSAESSNDDLTYSNMTEIVEIDNTVGRYDHGAIPGNQSLEEQPREHDTSGASRYDEMDKVYPPDGKIIITPPTGSKMIYYVLGITVTAILAVGIILIKKFVIRKK